MSDARTALERAIKDLEGIEPYPWEQAKRWVAKTRPLIRAHFAEHLEHFDKLAEPSWSIGGAYVAGTDLYGNPHDNFAEVDAENARANQSIATNAKAQLLHFLDGVKELTDIVPLGGAKPEPVDPRKVFVVHGRAPVHAGMHDFLRALHLEPLEFDVEAARLGGSPTNADVVRQSITTAQAVVVLCTPDEYAELAAGLETLHDEDTDKARWQPRANVILEAGWAFGVKRTSTILVMFGPARMPSDFDGVNYVRMGTGSIPERHKLAGRLKAIGCAVNSDGADWHTSGNLTVETPTRPAQKVKPGKSAPSTTMSDDAIKMRLEQYLRERSAWLSPSPNGLALFADIDEAAGVPPGSAARLLEACLPAVPGWSSPKRSEESIELQYTRQRRSINVPVRGF